MARTANPYTEILKRMTSVQAKAAKLNAEIEALSKFAKAEYEKTASPKKVVVKNAKSRKSLPKNAKKATESPAAGSAGNGKAIRRASRPRAKSAGRASPKKGNK